jgi:hypothetical protein
MEIKPIMEIRAADVQIEVESGSVTRWKKGLTSGFHL